MHISFCEILYAVTIKCMKSFKSIILFALISTNAFAIENSLHPFETDGCTMFVDGPLKRPGLWRHCCEEHDMRYWFGGDKADMDKTDLRLKECVNEVAGPRWANVIYKGVRAGHSAPVKNKMKWSWGWITERPLVKLNTEEEFYVLSELRRLPYDPAIIEKFIERNFKHEHEAF